MARVLASAFPTLAFTIFFLIRKTKEYQDEFATYPSRARLETNFWSGGVLTESQYWEHPRQLLAAASTPEGGPHG